MKYNINITWVVFWVFLGFTVYVLSNSKAPEPTQITAEKECIKNNGVPIHNSWGSMTDCKIYIKK